MKPTSKKIGSPTRNAAISTAQAARSCRTWRAASRPAPPAARVLQEAADHRAQSDHHRDEAESVAEAALDGLQHLVRRHTRRQPQRHAGDQQRQEGVQFHHQDQNQQQRHTNHREDDEVMCGTSLAAYPSKDSKFLAAVVPRIARSAQSFQTLPLFSVAAVLPRPLLPARLPMLPRPGISRTTLAPTSAPNPMPPLANPAPIPAAGIHACEIIPAPRFPDTLPRATVFPGLLVRGTMNVLFTAYSTRGNVPVKLEG